MKLRLIGGITAIILILGGISYYYLYYYEEGHEPICGDGICEPEYGESYETCPGDCPPNDHCGNGVCEPSLGENCATCPDDCGGCPPEPTGVGFRLPYTNVTMGDTFWVTLYCDHPGVCLGGWKISIGFDDVIVEVKEIKVDGVIWLYDTGDIVDDEITFIQAWTAREDLTSKMDLCRIKLYAKSTGSSPLSFNYFEMSDCDAVHIHPTTHDSSIIIQ